MSQSGDPNFFLKVPYKKFPLRVIPKIRGELKKDTKAERELNLGTIGLGN